METGLIKTLIAQHGSLCLSVIVPLKNSAREGAQNPLLVDKYTGLAEQELKLTLKKADALEYTRRLKALIKKVDYENSANGIGFFLSAKVSEVVPFHHEVKEKIIMGDRFELRDLWYELQSPVHYYVLGLSEKEIRLYKGTADLLREVSDSNFPKKFVDSYEYSRSSRAGSHGYAAKNTEKDKPVLELKRMETFFRSADKLLSPYINENTPLVISGVTKELALYKKITVHGKGIAGTITGNYSHDKGKLGKLAWLQINTLNDETTGQDLKHLTENSGSKNVVQGLGQVWKAAKEGKGFTLFVEKDFRKPAFIGKNEYRLHLRPPGEKHRIVADAVDEIIETVIGNGGKVTCVENGALEDYERIGLLLKYKKN